jgi:DNA-binding response OmpR family regulator
MNARPVLLIANDVEWCARVCQFLEPHGISVVAVENVDAAAHRLAQMEAPSAIVLESAARHEYGRDVSLLRRQTALSQVPVGYLKKSAALDALLLMLSLGVPGGHQHRAA